MDDSEQENIRELVLSAKSGEEEAFGRLYEIYFTPVFRYIYFRTKDKLIAENISQEVFLKSFENISRFEERGRPFLAYLFTIARNKVIDHWKKPKDVLMNEEREFADMESEFIERDLNGAEVDVNLPLLDPKEIKEFQVEIATLSDPNRTDNAFLQQENKIANTVIKSFITINETISFTVKGSIIRQPNKFIWIERDGNEEDYKKLWYVNSVTHRFEEGKYTTDIIATKIFGDTTAAAIEASKVNNS